MADHEAGRLAGRTALITGGASGMGREAVELFADEGAAVVVADLDEAGGSATVAAVIAAGGRADFVATARPLPAGVEAAVGCRQRRLRALQLPLSSVRSLPACRTPL